MSRIQDRIKALERLKDIDEHRDKYLIIHYSSESFFNLEGKSPRIASIAVEDLESGQTNLFAIYKTADVMGIEWKSITEQYSKIERKMLDDFFQFVQENLSDKKWLHWNMRDSSFGFQALEHRYKSLGGKPIVVSNNAKIDLAQLFKDIYGPNYIEDPKMFKLMEKNEFTPSQILNGKGEAKAFDNGEYYKLSMSTSNKVRLFVKFINHANENDLKTNSSKKQQYGDSLKSYWYRFTKTRTYKIGYSIFWLFLGALASKIIELFL